MQAEFRTSTFASWWILKPLVEENVWIFTAAYMHFRRLVNFEVTYFQMKLRVRKHEIYDSFLYTYVTSQLANFGTRSFRNYSFMFEGTIFGNINFYIRCTGVRFRSWWIFQLILARRENIKFFWLLIGFICSW